MKIEQQQHGNVLVLVPHGPLMREDADEFRGRLQTLAREHCGRVVVDMSQVPYLDSSGIECLLGQFAAAPGPAARPKLAALTETCREALDLTDTLARLDVFDTVENAIRSYRR